MNCHNGKYRGMIRSKIVFLESVKFQFQASMLSSEVERSFKSYGHISDLGVGIALSHRHVGFSGKANTSIHGLGEDDTASSIIDLCGSMQATIDNCLLGGLGGYKA